MILLYFATFSPLDIFFRKGSKMYDIIGFWLNFWLNPLRVSPLVGGRWVFHFSFFIFQIYVTCLIGGRSPWFADENVDPELELPGERQLERPPPWRMVRAPRVGSVCRTREEERAVEVPRIEGSSEPPSCRGLGKHFDADIAHGKTSLPVWPSAL